MEISGIIKERGSMSAKIVELLEFLKENEIPIEQFLFLLDIITKSGDDIR